MPLDPANPFSAPTANLETPAIAPSVDDLRLAPASTRLVAVLLDGLLFVPALFIFAYSSLTLGKPTISTNGLGGNALISLFAGLYCLAMLAYQIYLLTTTGQTLGKRWMKIKIVRLDGSPAGFVRAVLLRSVVNTIPRLVPGLGSAYGLVDALFIFRQDRRCIHDHIASTRVILAPDAQP